MSPEQELMRAQFKKEILTPPSEEEVQHTLDLVTGFALPVVKMEHLGDVVKGTGTLRSFLRRLVHAANRMPDSGPQDMRARVDTIKYAAGLPSRLAENWNWLLNHADRTSEGYYKLGDDLNRSRTWAQTLIHMAEGSGAEKRVPKVVRSGVEKPLGWEPSLQRTARKVEDVYE